MKIIFWLWNPWSKYENTRHNVWFLFLDFLIKDLNLEWDWYLNKKLKSEIFETIINGKKTLLVKPQTFMNLSWDSVLKVMTYYKIKKEDIIVVYDDISLEFWKIRYREKGSSGGQNWVKDIITKIWEDFPRIKIWIWIDRRFKVSSWVLSPFSPLEKNNLDSELFNNTKKILENNFLNK